MLLESATFLQLTNQLPTAIWHMITKNVFVDVNDELKTYNSLTTIELTKLSSLIRLWISSYFNCILCSNFTS